MALHGGMASPRSPRSHTKRGTRGGSWNLFFQSPLVTGTSSRLGQILASAGLLAPRIRVPRKTDTPRAPHAGGCFFVSQRLRTGFRSFGIRSSGMSAGSIGTTFFARRAPRAFPFVRSIRTSNGRRQSPHRLNVFVRPPMRIAHSLTSSRALSHSVQRASTQLTTLKCP